MDSNIPYYVMGCIAALAFLIFVPFFIIKKAIIEASKEQTRLLNVIIRLKAEQLKSGGASEDEVQRIIKSVK